MSSTSVKRAFILLWAVVLLGFAAVFAVLLHNNNRGGQQAAILSDQISIRQSDGKIQYRLSGMGDWQDITTVSALTGKDGQDGTNGVDGEDGADGKDGVVGRDGATGATGPSGLDGADGQDGVDGVDGMGGIDGKDGADGREIELQKDLYFIQWRYVGEAGWRNLIAYSDLKGEKGDAGPANSLSIGTVSRTDCTPAASITGTAPNQTLNLGMPGIPTGGATGQVLTKNSGDDCDVSWSNGGPQLLREIVWSGNDVAQPIAVDESTGIFTAPGHGLRLSSGSSSVMATFRNGEVDYLPKYAPGGFPLNLGQLHFVPVDGDRFYLSLSNNGPAVTYTNNPDMDLSKIQFEQANIVDWSSGISQYRITGLGDRNYARVEIIGKNSLRYVNQGDRGPDKFIGNSDIYGSMQVGGFAYARSEVIIDTTGDFLELSADVRRWNYDTATRFDFSSSTRYSMNPGKPARAFSTVMLDNGHIANGTIIRVWSE